MIDKILEPWTWYISGPLIAMTMALLILMGRKLGMSSILRTVCTISGAGRFADFFNFNWKEHSWNLLVMFGAIIGGFIGAHYLSIDESVAISEASISKLNELGFSNPGANYVPLEVYGMEAISNIKGILILAVGGLLIGFGTRYAGGCTSGHAISGLSNLQMPSLIAVIGFFAGGLLMIHVLFPLIF